MLQRRAVSLDEVRARPKRSKAECHQARRRAQRFGERLLQLSRDRLERSGASRLDDLRDHAERGNPLGRVVRARQHADGREELRPLALADAVGAEECHNGRHGRLRGFVLFGAEQGQQALLDERPRLVGQRVPVPELLLDEQLLREYFRQLANLSEKKS